MDKVAALTALRAFRDSYYEKEKPDRSEEGWYERRMFAVKTAKDAGATFVEIGEILFMSPGRVSDLYKKAKGICPCCGQTLK